MKIYISKRIGSAYAIIDGALMFATMSEDNTFDTEDFSGVDEDLKDEPTGNPDDLDNPVITLGDIWERARDNLAK